MKSPSNENSKPIMINSSVKKNTTKALESYYNESRENAYNRQKDLNRDIEIDVPELIDRELTHPHEEGWERDDINDLNDRSNSSANLMKEYKVGQANSPQQKAILNSRTKRDYQQTSISSKNTQNVRSVERQIEDFYKWQDRIKKKHEMQREFQEQVRDSMHDQKVFTNEVSNQIIESKRPNAKIENILLSHGKAKEIRLKKLEEAIYGKQRIPNITKKAQNLHHSQKVHTRLYDLDKSRREKSRESLSRNLSRSTELQRSKSKDMKRKSLYSLLRASNTQELHNVDLFYSPRDIFSPVSSIQKTTRNFSKDHVISPQAIIASPSLTSFGSPLHSVRNGEFPQNRNIWLQNPNEKNGLIMTPRTQTSPVNDKRGQSQNKANPISIYKRLTPFSGNKQDGKNFALSQPELDQRKGSFASNSQHNAKVQSPEQLKKGNNKIESTPVLPNMMFFKSAERPISSTPTTMSAKEKELPPRLVESYHPYDMKSMEAFWERILQDDLESRGRRMNGFNENRNYYDEDYSSPQKFDFNERNMIWLNKKNKKIDDQRKLKEERELSGCTFKPQLYSQDKLNQKNSQQLYQNFLHRMALSSSNSPSILNDPNLHNRKNFNPGDFDVLNMMNSGYSESPKTLGNYSEENELQKKLYNYILNSKN